MKTVNTSSKKAQIGMVEMIMVMVVVTILLVIGLVFYFRFSISGMEQTGERIEEERAAVIISTITQLPEIECTFLGGRASKSCTDTIKLLALSTREERNSPYFQEHRRHYSDLLGYMTISFEQIYPETNGEECTPEKFSDPSYPLNWECGKWVIYDNPRPNTESTFRTMPIALYYPSQHIYTFGQIRVDLYQ